MSFPSSYNRIITAILILLTFKSCVPLNQQTASDDNGDIKPCQTIIMDPSLYDETVALIRDGSPKAEDLKYKPYPSSYHCASNPRLKLNFQSGYSKTKAPYIKNHCLLIPIAYGGGFGNDCEIEVNLINDGFLRRDEKKRIVLNIILSFKNIDIRRAMVHNVFWFDLSSLKIPTKEKIYLRLYGQDELMEYTPI